MSIMRMSFLVVFWLVISLEVKADQSSNPNVIFAIGEWAPYTSQHLPGYGVAAELVSAITAASNITPEYNFYPWIRAEVHVREGDAFATFPYVITDGRQRIYNISDVLFHGIHKFSYYVEAGDSPLTIDYEDIEDLREYRIGVMNGSYFQEQLDKLAIPYETSTTVDQSVHKLKLGRIDFYLDSPAIISAAIKRMYPESISQFKFLPKPFDDEQPYVLLVSRKYPDSESLLNRFNTGLRVIKENGTYDRILTRHGFNH